MAGGLGQDGKGGENSDIVSRRRLCLSSSRTTYHGIPLAPGRHSSPSLLRTAEHAQAHAERKIKLQEKINQLESGLQAQLQKAKERREAAELEARAQVELLQKKAAAKAKAAELPIQS